MNLHTLKWLPFCAALLLITPVVWAQTPTPTPGVKHYKFKIVNPNTNAETSVRGINNYEIFVGDTASEAQFANNTENGFVAKESWLQQFSVPKSYGATDTDANDISNRNVILGMYDIRSTDPLVDGDHGFLLDEKGFHKLPDPDFTVYDRRPDWNGINAEGEIVGIAFNLTTFKNDSFILEDGNFTYYQGSQISSAYGTLEFNAINDREPEAIVGEVQDATTGTSHGVLFKAGKFYVFDFPGAFDTTAFGVNNKGDIVGSYTDPVTFVDHGFLLKDFPEHPKWFTVDSGNPTYPDTTIRTINDQGVIGGVLATGGFGPHTEVGFVAEPKDR